jgi:hypothetical protein
MRRAWAERCLGVEQEELVVERGAGRAHREEEPEPTFVFEERRVHGGDVVEEHLLELPTPRELGRAV